VVLLAPRVEKAEAEVARRAMEAAIFIVVGTVRIDGSLNCERKERTLFFLIGH
jgi:hypothetical protein